jgi:hypothetical protein
MTSSMPCPTRGSSIASSTVSRTSASCALLRSGSKSASSYCTIASTRVATGPASLDGHTSRRRTGLSGKRSRWFWKRSTRRTSSGFAMVFGRGAASTMRYRLLNHAHGDDADPGCVRFRPCHVCGPKANSLECPNCVFRRAHCEDVRRHSHARHAVFRQEADHQAAAGRRGA